MQIYELFLYLFINIRNTCKRYN